MANKAERIKSGIPGLDELIGGGFVKGHGILLTGSYGTGKSLFGMQFAVYGAMHGENSLFISFEEEPGQIREEAEEFGWDIKGLEKGEKLKIVRITPQDLLNLVEVGFGQIGSIIKSMNVKRVVVDTILTFDLLGKDEFERKRYLLDFITWFKKHGCTVIMTMDTDPGEELSPNTNIAESTTDAILILYHTKKGNRRTRTMEILKMRETAHTNQLVNFTISDKGVSVEGIKE